MYELTAPPPWVPLAFAALTVAVAAADVVLVRLAAPTETRRRWTLVAALAATVWLLLHAGIAESGVLEGASFPPPVMPYLVVNIVFALLIVFSFVGTRLSGLPTAVLVGLQSFRLPVEWLLHELYTAGTLPQQMTWSGYNFDVVTAILAIPLAAALFTKKRVPDGVILAWNIIGLGLLLNVVTIALLSAPLPLRQFHNEPAVLLVFHAPYNWIVNVHVFTALVGHLVIFRALARRRHGTP